MVGVHAPIEKLLRWAHRTFDFVELHPRLFAEHLRDPALRHRLVADIPDVVAAEGRIREVLAGQPGFVAFAHWNANIDNCWFQRDAAGDLECGFIDWANAGTTSVAQSIIGALSGAEPHVWADHLDHLLADYVEEFAAQGAPKLDVDELRLHVLLMTAVSGIGFSMGAPGAIEREIADIDALDGPHDEVLRTHDNARIQLHMMTKLLENWQAFALGAGPPALTLTASRSCGTMT